jgi:hypothetical protein
MDLDQLRSMGLVSANPLLKREIKIKYRPLLPKDQWNDPNIEERQDEEVEGVLTTWLRKLTASDQIAIAAASRAGRDVVSLMIHLCTFKEDGSRVFPTEADAAGLDPVMFASLLVEINKINEGIGKKSRPRTKLGANSRSPSAAEASPNGSSTSALKSSESGGSSERSTAH